MICVLGSINLDQIGTVARLPHPGETVAGGSFAIAAGGKGANQALAARRAGAKVRLVGAVGSDRFAEPALAELAAASIDLAGVRTVPGATGIAMILVDGAGENVIAVLPGANGTLTPADADQALAGLGAGDLLLVQQEIGQAVTAHGLALARARGVRTILNTAPFLPDTPALAETADIVIANATEFDLLVPDTEPLATRMAAFSARRGQLLVVTLGPDGVRAHGRDGALAVPALPVTPVDTVGAGDTFCGYLAAALAEGLALAPALRLAAVAGSLACLAPGAQPAIPHRAAVLAALG